MQKLFIISILALVFGLFCINPSLAVIPIPKSFYDFEEQAGTMVTDLGPAANHGEMMGDFIDWQDGGIVSKDGESDGCIEFLGESFTGMGYVEIPFQDFMNSPNYTLSAWVQWIGDPNWGYVFWQQGEVWPEEDKSRHIDVWWNPNNKCIDNILHTVDGTEFRINYMGDDFGIDVHDGDWHLVTVTLEDNITYTIYIDGMFVVSATSDVDIIENDGDDLWLGARPNDATGENPVKMVGLMDRVRIWDVVLTEEQIEELYDSEGSGGGTKVALITPKSYYDFEEQSGDEVKDLGPAQNHGTMMGDFIDWQDGGVISAEGEKEGCIEFLGEATSGMGYILIPYQDFLNSPNYTLSAWVQWLGDPNWGYVFWMQGEVWPEEDQSRHIDVWWNPNNKCIDNILHTEEGSEWRINYMGDDLGIDVFDGDWHLVSVSLENNAIYTVYIDGELAAKDTSEIPVIENDGDDLWLGARPNDAGGENPIKMVGLMDRVMIWDMVLSQAHIEAVFENRGPGITRVTDKSMVRPIEKFALCANYPNPFNPFTHIRYRLDDTHLTTLTIFNSLGQTIRTLVQTVQGPGEYEVQWDGRNDWGIMVPSGMYFYKLTAGQHVEVQKMMLLK